VAKAHGVQDMASKLERAREETAILQQKLKEQKAASDTEAQNLNERIKFYEKTQRAFEFQQKKAIDREEEIRKLRQKLAERPDPTGRRQQQEVDKLRKQVSELSDALKKKQPDTTRGGATGQGPRGTSQRPARTAACAPGALRGLTRHSPRPARHHRRRAAEETPPSRAPAAE